MGNPHGRHVSLFVVRISARPLLKPVGLSRVSWSGFVHAMPRTRPIHPGGEGENMFQRLTNCCRGRMASTSQMAPPVQKSRPSTVLGSAEAPVGLAPVGLAPVELPKTSVALPSPQSSPATARPPTPVFPSRDEELPATAAADLLLIYHTGVLNLRSDDVDPPLPSLPPDPKFYDRRYCGEVFEIQIPRRDDDGKVNWVGIAYASVHMHMQKGDAAQKSFYAEISVGTTASTTDKSSYYFGPFYYPPVSGW